MLHFLETCFSRLCHKLQRALKPVKKVIPSQCPTCPVMSTANITPVATNSFLFNPALVRKFKGVFDMFDFVGVTTVEKDGDDVEAGRGIGFVMFG